MRPLPPQGEVEERLAVMLLRSPRPMEARQAYERLADEFRLTAEQLRSQYGNGDNEWGGLVRSAYRGLKDQGYACKPPPDNEWSLTDDGIEYAKRIERRPFLSADDLGL